MYPTDRKLKACPHELSEMQALHDVVKAGYVRYIGMSSCYAWQCTSISSKTEV